MCPIFGEIHPEEGNAIPKGGKRQVVKAGLCEQILQA